MANMLGGWARMSMWRRQTLTEFGHHVTHGRSRRPDAAGRSGRCRRAVPRSIGGWSRSAAAPGTRSAGPATLSSCSTLTRADGGALSRANSTATSTESKPALGTIASTWAIARSPPGMRRTAWRSRCSGSGRWANGAPQRARLSLQQRDVVLPVIAGLAPRC